MYSDKKNVLQLTALLEAHGITHIVLCPGSRNAPLVHTWAQYPRFKCFSVVDERSAAFFALGLIQKLRKPVAVCCTSGTALLNMGPAVAEAFYQQLPLLVISADRPKAWIGQMDGQTIPQENAFASFVRKFVQLPEIIDEETSWYCNRLINEAVLSMEYRGKGPVHINIPLSEPLFTFNKEYIPDERVIRRSEVGLFPLNNSFSKVWKKYSKRMILIGQSFPDPELIELLREVKEKYDCLIVAEHLSNITSEKWVTDNLDTLIYALPDELLRELRPDILITVGGHIVSKRIKKWLRMQPPKEHWHIAEDGQVTDLFQHVSCVAEGNLRDYLQLLIIEGNPDNRKEYTGKVNAYSQKIYHLTEEFDFPYSDLSVVSAFMKALPAKTSLQVGNSSAVRNIQCFPLGENIDIYCNRGTSGIEGSVSTAVGFASINEKLTFLLIGDLSFFYDMNGLWNRHLPASLRILLLNNGCGEIFHLLPGLKDVSTLEGYVAAHHTTSVKGWAESIGCLYLSAANKNELEEGMKEFTDTNIGEKPIIFEIKTSPDVNADVFRKYFHAMKLK